MRQMNVATSIAVDEVMEAVDALIVAHIRNHDSPHVESSLELSDAQRFLRHKVFRLMGYDHEQ